MTPIPSSFRNPPQSQLTHTIWNSTPGAGKNGVVYIRCEREGRGPTSVHINCQKCIVCAIISLLLVCGHLSLHMCVCTSLIIYPFLRSFAWIMYHYEHCKRLMKFCWWSGLKIWTGNQKDLSSSPLNCLFN